MGIVNEQDYDIVSMNLSLVEYYKNLLIMQYRDKTKARGHIGNILSAGMIYDIMVAVRDGFDLETARGAQLDVLGRILGVSRTITGTTFTRAYYGYMLYGDTAPFTFNPMLLYGAETGDVQFRNYKEGQQSLYDLTDEEYRVILKLAIVRNNSNASVKTIDEILFNLFGSDCYFIDRMNMTVVSYMVGEKWSRIFGIAKSTGLLPNPAGVGTSLVVVPDINNIFGYSLYGGSHPVFTRGYSNYFNSWSLVGNPLNINVGQSSMAALSLSRIAIVDNINNKLRAYDFNGTDFTLSGNELTLTIGYSAMASLSSSRIALIDNFTNKLRAYDFGGTDWTLTGNELSLSGIGFPALTSLSSSRIALFDNNNNKLGAYDFDGTDWTLTGNELSLSGIGLPSMADLSSSRIAFADNNKLRAYDFDGTDWSLTGNELSLVDVGLPAIAGLSSSRISLIDNSTNKLRAYDFDGTDWTLTGNELSLSGIGLLSMASLSFERITFIDNNNDKLQVYDYLKGLDGCMARYS